MAKSKKNKKDDANYVDYDAMGDAYAGRTR
jgi:hypothetical protein